MANNSIKTSHFTRLDILRSLNAPFITRPYSTLNEAAEFDIGHISPPSEGYPTIKYMTIGRGGHVNVPGSNNLTDIQLHNPTDAVLFEHIPFVMRPVSDDLSPAERSKYRIRVKETYGGNDYMVYYAMVISTDNVIPEERIITLLDGNIVSDVPLIPSAASLTPTPVNISNTNVNVVNGDHLVVQAIMTITLNAADIVNIVEACTIKFGDARYATISEMGMVGGFDISVTNSLSGTSATYLELQCGQIMSFISIDENLRHLPNSITLQYALSNSMPYNS